MWTPEQVEMLVRVSVADFSRWGGDGQDCVEGCMDAEEVYKGAEARNCGLVLGRWF